MRHTLLFFNALLFFVAVGYAQSPPGINYQGVARDNTGKQLSLKDISIKISIVKGSAEGTIEYSETHSVKTNSFGLFTLVIGNGNAITGDFQFVSWAVGDKWLRVEMDPGGGSSFQLLGSQQLMSVPYAFYAKFSGNSLTAGQGISITNNAINNTGDSDNNPSNELNTALTLGSDLKLKLTDAGGTKEVDLSPLAIDTDTDTDTDKQNLSFDGTKNLSIERGNTVDISGVNTDNQDLSLAGNTLSLTNDATTVDLGAYMQNLDKVLTQGNDAGGKKITNIGTPTATTDAVTKQYVDDADNVINARISANYAFKTSFTHTAGSNNEQVPFSAEVFDDFNVIGTSNFTAAVNGTYVFTIEGGLSVPVVATVSLLYNGTKYAVPIGLNYRFNSSFMFRLTQGQTVSLVADNLGIGTTITGTFFGYKLL